jgi:hypothetical protein
MCGVAGFIVQSYAFTRVRIRMKTRAQYFKRRVILYAGVFLSSFLLVATVWAINGDWMKYFRLSRSGKWTEGKRIDANRIEVEYWISKSGYITQPGLFNFELNSGVGDQRNRVVPVVYWPANPQVACACEPRESLRNMSYNVALWTSFIALMVTFGYHHFRKDYWDE